jgi:CMP-N-acetylneuraminic acid synthetase
MSDRKRALAVAVILARGGSKGIPGKNLLKLGGIPLLARAVLAARGAGRIKQVYVSSDDEGILSVAAEYGGLPVRRPADLAGDTSPSELALLHALTFMRTTAVDPDILVFLQCTSPFTSSSDVDCLVAALDESVFQSALTVIEDHSFLWAKDDRGEAVGINHDPAKPRAMRQQLPPQYRESGAGYAMRVGAFERSGNRFCPPVALVQTSHPPLEIDTLADLKFAETLLERREV